MSTDANWPYKAGEKGRNRVRAYPKGDSGIIYLEFYERDPETGELSRKRVSTGHRDREKAKKEADQLAAKFTEAPPEPDPPGITLRTLFDNYLEKRTPQVGERQQKHHHRATEMFCRYFGWSREAESLNRKDWDGFILDRRSGAIDARGNSVPKDDRKPIGPRRVQEDLQALRAVLNWGTQADLLDRNPTAGYPLPKDPNPQRPRVTEERYQAMLEVAPEIDWRFEVALVLANETGHRSKAIRHLKWADVDLSAQTIRWRGEADKSSHEHVTPLTKAATKALKGAQENRAAIGDTWVLPSPEDDSKPVSRHLLRDWWYRAEELAELDHIDGLGWHGLRRKFADEHKEVPLKDLAKLGGWKTEQTILTCYQDSNLEAMRRAQERRRELREASTAGD